MRFRKAFSYAGGAADLRITADSRYQVRINGISLGFGPGRSWPAHRPYDAYGIAPLLDPAKPSVVDVLVNPTVRVTSPHKGARGIRVDGWSPDHGQADLPPGPDELLVIGEGRLTRSHCRRWPAAQTYS